MCGKSGELNLPLVSRASSFHSRVYQVYYGFTACPWFEYSQTMISEVSPLPQMYVSSLFENTWAWVSLTQVPFLCTFFGGKLPWYFLCAAETGQQMGQTSTFIGPIVSSAITTASGNDNMPFAFLFGLWVSWQRSISYWLEIFSQWGVEYYLSLDGRRWQESKGMRRVHFGREFPSSIYPIGIRWIANCIRELFWGEKCGVFLTIFVLRRLVPCHTDEPRRVKVSGLWFLSMVGLVCIHLLKWDFFSTLIPLLLSYYSSAVDHRLSSVVSPKS